MEAQLKQRLIGAIAVVALAVVFVPMILNGKAPDSGRSGVIHAPQTTQNYPENTRMAGHSFSLSERTNGSGTNLRYAGQNPPSEFRAIVEGRNPQDAIIQTDTQPAVTSVAARPRPTQPRNTGTSSTRAANTSTATRPPVNSTRSETPTRVARTGFTVQVGSFAVKNNAQQRVNFLQSKGFNSFLDEVKVGTEMRYRVRVGARPKRTEALKLGNELKQKTGFSFFVTSIE